MLILQSFNHTAGRNPGLAVGVEVAALRQKLNSEFEEMRIDDPDHYRITQEQPCHDLFIEWIYEIDLDNEWILGLCFALAVCPFLKSIGFDSYGHRAYRSSTPMEYRYDWKAPPPEIPQEVVDRYRSCSVEDSCAPVHELLGVPESLAVPEATRVQFFQVTIGFLMKLQYVGLSIRRLERVTKRDEILVALGRTIVKLSIGPAVHNKTSFKVLPKDVQGFTWLYSRVCLRITTHLNDERNLRATVLDLVDAAMGHPDVRVVVYGVWFSFFHCVVVRIDTDNEGSFKHTAALNFLPSWYAKSPSTDGITALVRLGYLFNALDLLGIPPTHELPTNHLLHRVPQETWMVIASHIYCLSDYVVLGSISPLARKAVGEYLKYPHVEGNRISRLKPTTQVGSTDEKDLQPKADDMSDDSDGEEGSAGNTSLWRAEFEVVRDGQSGLIMEVVEPFVQKELAKTDQGVILFDPEFQSNNWRMEYVV